MNKVTIVNLQKKIPVCHSLVFKLKKAVLGTISSENMKKTGEIDICLVNDKKIRELSKIYLKINNSTDVIAFDISEPAKPGKMLVEIVISTDKAVSNAHIFNTTPVYELFLYIIHGMLHILGYDDRTARQRQIMEKKTDWILTTLGLLSHQ